jgi:hypothetical protein
MPAPDDNSLQGRRPSLDGTIPGTCTDTWAGWLAGWLAGRLGYRT